MLHKITSVAALIALLLTLCACSVKANSTYTGTIASVSADSITLETADGKVSIKLTDNTQFTIGGFGQRGQMPDGDMTRPTGEEHPESAQKPKGDVQKPDGDMPEDMTFPEGEIPKDATIPQGEMPEGNTRSKRGSFENFSGNSAGMDLSSIPAGTSVTVTTGADKTAITISLSINFSPDSGQKPNSQN